MKNVGSCSKTLKNMKLNKMFLILNGQYEVKNADKSKRR